MATTPQMFDTRRLFQREVRALGVHLDDEGQSRGWSSGVVDPARHMATTKLRGHQRRRQIVDLEGR